MSEDLENLEKIAERVTYRRVLDGRGRNRVPFGAPKGNSTVGRADPKRADAKLRKF